MTEEKPQVPITKEGYENLKKELKYREGELRKKLQDTLNQMRSQGDLSENDGYTIAVTDFQTNEDKILTIHETLENAVIVDKKKATKVDVGSHVVIECEKGNKKEKNSPRYFRLGFARCRGSRDCHAHNDDFHAIPAKEESGGHPFCRERHDTDSIL